MENQKFTDVVNEQVEICLNMLVSKNDHYNPATDKLQSFKKAAHLGDETQAQALGGMMRKHTVSIYDMINSGQKYSMEQWNEKITDHINYLLLLKSVVVEEQGDDALAVLREKLMSVPKTEVVAEFPKTNYDPKTREYI